MAIEPAAISAKPPTTIRRVELTAPDRPAASANGTVNPSAMPITTSRTKRPAVKCDSTCGVRGIWVSDLRMRFEIFLGLAHDLALPTVSELCGGIFHGKPESATYFNARFWSNFVEPAGLVAHQIQTDNLNVQLLRAPVPVG